MARKVFISVLGTGFYSECVYKMGEFRSDTTRFIQQATLQMLTQQKVGGEWTKDDQIYIVLTEKAKESNWEVPRGKRYNPKDAKEVDYIGLKSVFEQMQLPTPIKTIDIPDGNNEKELWGIFDKIYTVLESGDELYFDLTHGFRYLPMMVLVLGNYAKFLKHTEVKSITYGNYESRDKGTNAAADYLEHGDATKLKICADKPLITIARETKGQDQDATTLIKLSKQLYEFSNLISFNRGDEIIIGKQSEQIKALLEKADAEYIRPMGPLFKQIAKSARNFNPDSPENMIEASRLCLDHSDFQASITLLQEGIVSMLCRKFHLDVKDKGDREIATQALNKLGLELQNKEYRPLSPYKETIIKRIIDSGIIS
ncbi:MAG TPA: TM1812 family CRISPR-associated protein, partial [Muribaculaceae bacterium]|nr:TM1812 family CRISPR-associated protein [Muribaculaceae bacterium]